MGRRPLVAVYDIAAIFHDAKLDRGSAYINANHKHILPPNRSVFIRDARYAIWCVLAILFTTSIGQPIVLYVASLGNVDHFQIEASQVDGASKWQTFLHVKWPSLLPTTLYVLVITTINSFQCFALIQLLTRGGPNGSTSTVMYYLYDTAFKLYRYGYANAMGVILAILIALFSAFQFRLMRTND